MRNVLLTFIACSLLPACLPEPTDLFFGDSSETRADEEYDYNPEWTGSEESEILHAVTSFVFDRSLLLLDETSDEPMENSIDEDEINKNFGADDLSLYCVEETASPKPIGFVKILIERFAPDEALAIESWQRRLDVPCAGKIDFKYYELFEGHSYNVKIEHLKLDLTSVKTISGSFTVPEGFSDHIPFELK